MMLFIRGGGVVGIMKSITAATTTTIFWGIQNTTPTAMQKCTVQ